jgi:hypothetical protein
MFGYQVAISLAATILIPCAVGIIRFRTLSRHYRLIVLLLALGFFTEALMFSLPYFGVNNLVGLHFYALAEIILLSMFFIHQLKSVAEKRIVWIAMACVSAICLLYAAVGNNITGFNSLPRAIECIYLSGLCGYVFYEMLLEPGPKEDALYFVNGAVLFYFSSSFIVFAFSKYLAPHGEDLLVMYNVHSIINAICNIAYAAGLWIASRSPYPYSRG